MATPDDPDWVWFPSVKSAWSLDVVNLLVVIGESSIAEHAQTITASLPGMLPRILPAPQALLKPARPTRMPETHARMTGVYSGTTLDSVGFFANIITPLDTLPPFSFKVLEIKHTDGTGLAEPVPMATKTKLARSPPFPALAALAAGLRRFVKRATTASTLRANGESGRGNGKGGGCDGDASKTRAAGFGDCQGLPDDDDDDDDDDLMADGAGRQQTRRHGCLNPHRRDEESGCSRAAAFAHQNTQAHGGATTAAAAGLVVAAAAAAAAAPRLI
ncbi:hypothetical protein E4U42_007263, partial [Claviceps africana]